MELRLLVVRTSDLERLTAFYSLFGVTFDYHKHGKSPYHYSATLGSTILEIYPLAKGQSGAEINLRLGFAVNNFETIVKLLKDKETEFLSEPMQTDYGFMAVIKDSDGRKLELYKM